jgi:hypothetical protein
MKRMSSLDFDFDLDTQLSGLELEWRRAYESSIVARIDYHALAGCPETRVNLLAMARRRLDRVESLKARILAKIEQLEDNILGQD